MTKQKTMKKLLLIWTAVLGFTVAHGQTNQNLLQIKKDSKAITTIKANEYISVTIDDTNKNSDTLLRQNRIGGFIQSATDTSLTMTVDDEMITTYTKRGTYSEEHRIHNSKLSGFSIQTVDKQSIIIYFKNIIRLSNKDKKINIESKFNTADSGYILILVQKQ